MANILQIHQKSFLNNNFFYKTLYSSRNINDYDESFFNHDIKLTEDQKDLCEGNLTFKECASH